MKDILDDFQFDEPEFTWDERDAAEVVGKYFSVTEAEIAAARLRSEGVPCFVANATAQAVLPHVPGFVRLHVRPMDAARAREILAEAAIDAEEDLRKTPGNGGIIVLAVLIGLILAFLLAKAVSGQF